MKYGNKIFNEKYLRLCTRNFSKSDQIRLSHKVICNKLKLCYDVKKNSEPSFHDSEVYASKASSFLAIKTGPLAVSFHRAWANFENFPSWPESETRSQYSSAVLLNSMIQARHKFHRPTFIRPEVYHPIRSSYGYQVRTPHGQLFGTSPPRDASLIMQSQALSY